MKRTRGVGNQPRTGCRRVCSRRLVTMEYNLLSFASLCPASFPCLGRWWLIAFQSPLIPGPCAAPDGASAWRIVTRWTLTRAQVRLQWVVPYDAYIHSSRKYNIKYSRRTLKYTIQKTSNNPAVNKAQYRFHMQHPVFIPPLLLTYYSVTHSTQS